MSSERAKGKLPANSPAPGSPSPSKRTVKLDDDISDDLSLSKVLNDCFERQWMTHEIIDKELGMEADDQAYLNYIIDDFAAILLGDFDDNDRLTLFQLA
ncbi:hypothetical protein PENFLA_c001G05377 [Penicillium flavigenum]|uniref:Uncharacterized protein n=1 Tax=Penicillium flavigenum TaxID=254877 RepID=A0A1V6U308_9EURO|nr:hypothetical protein PENFLA_c001G05377 [Penicillium flavigenum]